MKTRFLHSLLVAFGLLMQSSLFATEEYSYLALPEPEPESASEGSGNPFENIDIDQLPRFHRRNLPVEPDEMLLTRSCEELDLAISYLLPDTYSYKPAAFDDQYHGAAVWGSTISEFGIFEYSWLYLPYSWLIGYLEQGQQHDAFYHVEKMRRAKAAKNCYVY